MDKFKRIKDMIEGRTVKEINENKYGELEITFTDGNFVTLGHNAVGEWYIIGV